MNTTETYQTSSTSNPYNPNPYNPTPAKSKYRPYRNRPSKRQALLEFLSFLILLAAGPVFLGGVFAIFICIACFALGIIGLFAWTRRHIGLFSLLAMFILAALIVNIILRAVFVAQCLPYFYYASPNRFAVAGAGAGFVDFPDIPNVPTNNTVPSNTTIPTPTPTPNPTNSTLNDTTIFRQSNDDNNNNDGNNDDEYDGDEYNNSVWCGDRKVVYITHAILIALILPALLIALSLLKKRKTTGLPVSSTTTTTTEKRRTFIEQ